MNREQPRVINIPGRRLRQAATTLLHLHPLHSSSSLPPPPPPSPPPIRIVCISDTHNTQPDLPFGEILIHAGDLTENGSFDELQEQLAWLSRQPHPNKVVVAGNHDVLLDDAFLEKYPERKYRDSRTMQDLEWGDLHYLRDSSITLNVAAATATAQDRESNDTRTMTIYGSPQTPQYGVSAFQYPRDQNIWANNIPHNTDIVIAHGPPRLHLDQRDFHSAGCPYLAHEIARVRPRLVVFGHIHVSYGREDVVLDWVRRGYEMVMNQWAGWEVVGGMAIGVLVAKLRHLFKLGGRREVTTFVNAAVVGGSGNELMNSPIVVEL
ncbi:hypothetical protein FQN54_003130 [Arachnomyces sp. PD_36]|nr:hypothetical protein FQN54_003130 [Arachnomyces sp. PD_36]